MTGRDAVRDQLAAALGSHRNGGIHDGAWVCDCGDRFAVLADWLTHRAASLLPVVDRLAKERAAAELRAAADVWEKHGNSWRQILAHNTAPFEYARWARTRADALDPS